MEALSTDTQATLLLVGRFAKSSEPKPLSTSEYNRLAKQLQELGLRPGHLLRELPKDLVVDRERTKKLLGRGTSLALAVERWGQLGIRVIGRGDPDYPGVLKSKLRSATAPILYIAGNHDILTAKAVCVVGSRDATPDGIEFARSLGKRAASEDLCILSGDARGVDRAAMEGALAEGGRVVGVLVEAFARAVIAKRNRDAMLAGNLLLISPYDPEAAFTVANAMDRNKYMYALAAAAVIVDSDTKGGTWSGAVENQKHCWTRAFVRLPSDAPLGNRRLAELGLTPILDSPDEWAETLRDWLTRSGQGVELQSDLLSPRGIPAVEAKSAPDSLLFAVFLDHLVNWLSQAPQTEADIAERFDLEWTQARRWLDKARAKGLLEKLKATSCYAIPQNSSESEPGYYRRTSALEQR